MGSRTNLFRLAGWSLTTTANRCILALAAVACLAEAFPQQQQQHQNNLQNYHHHQSQPHRQRAVFARRAADDSRPLPRANLQQQQQQQEEALVLGKFRAPAPEQMQRIPKRSKSGSQTVTASFRVADVDESRPEKIVHGVLGASAQQQQQQELRQKTVGAKIQVSDEGLNYPPSKLSADIYGNVAEIVTAPPEAVENDFLIPTSTRHQTPNSRRFN